MWEKLRNLAVARGGTSARIGLGPRASVGLDLGSHALKVAELIRSGGGYKVARLGMLPTPPGAVSKGVAVNPAVIVPAIHALLLETGIRSKRVATALGGQAVIIRAVTMPEMSEAELAQAATFEAERYVPPGTSEVRCQYRVLGRIPEDGQLEVLLVATGKELIDRHRAPLVAAGLASEMMEVTPLSAVRAVARDGQNDEATVYVDIGAEGSDILVLEGERVRLARNIAIGGNALTTAITEAMNLDFAPAQALKEQRAELLLDGEQPADRTVQNLHQAILPVLTRLGTELRRSLDFYLARLRGRAISRIILTGGTAKLKNLAPFLSREIGLPVEIGNPFAMCEADANFSPQYLADVAPMMAVAVGLALGGG
jgi:type IV pilus assembly protein PilM